METTPGRKRGRPRRSTKAKTKIESGALKIRCTGSGEKRNAAEDESYWRWKQLVPVLYDWLAHHNLAWPSLSCRWGPVVEKGTYKNTQRIYLSEQTDQTEPNTLIIANCEVVKQRVAADSHISNFSEDARSPYVKNYKTILHPGEVNRIRELPQNTNIVAKHTDSPEVLIWDTEPQPNRDPVLGSARISSRFVVRVHLTLKKMKYVKVVCAPYMRWKTLNINCQFYQVLSGQQEIAEFALAMCPAEPFVLSGGRDKSVVLWSIQDHVPTLAADATHSAGSGVKSAENSTVSPRGVFQGHTNTVEDVQFCPSSVGDDSCLILWDARFGGNPVVKVEKAHDADLHCVDWNSLDENHILTGSADHTVCIFDRRSLTANGVGSPLHKFGGHTAPVLCVQWCPDKHTVFGSSGEDGLVNIWDSEKVGLKEETGSKSPAGLFFRHAGHRDKVADFHWNVSDPWTIVSVSNNGECSGGGGTLQMWRMIDLLHRPEEEVLDELHKFKDHVLDCSKDETK